MARGCGVLVRAAESSNGAVYTSCCMCRMRAFLRLERVLGHARISLEWEWGSGCMGLWEGCGSATAVQGGGDPMGVPHRTGLSACGSCGVAW
eukprot:3265397-Prymnesium_polylepis.1